MSDQEDYTELDYKWLDYDDILTCFKKDREQIVGMIKGE